MIWRGIYQDGAGPGGEDLGLGRLDSLEQPERGRLDW
jgi:hypothetical protein